MGNLHQTLHNTVNKPCFHNNLEISKKRKDEIIQTRTLIRERLRLSLESFSLSKEGGSRKISPKFFTQGSWAYKTLNKPYKAPPQQIDCDDGMYLPVSYLDAQKPSIAAKAYFDATDKILEQLCAEKKWTLDSSKNTCSRVVVDREFHFDVPLYAISDSGFQRFVEAISKVDTLVNTSSYQFTEEDWDLLDTSGVLIAERSGNWIESDPKKIHKWFVNSVLEKGEQLRRLCRYLKAWRDTLWDTGGPSSIFLMVCCSQLFSKVEGRDDLALLKVLENIGSYLETEIFNPVEPSESLSKRQKVEDLVLLSSASRFICIGLKNGNKRRNFQRGSHFALVKTPWFKSTQN